MNLHPTYSNPIRHHSNSIVAYPAGDPAGGKIVEIGPGRGDFLFHLAELHPDKMISGIEIKSRRFEKLVARRDRRGLGNVKLYLSDACFALPRLFNDDSVEAIYINFPDPWPKRRHTRNRVLNEAFLKDCARVLVPGGILSITTDVEWYAKETFERLKKVGILSPTTAEVCTESDEAYPTFFSEKWKREGRTIYYQKHVKEKISSDTSTLST